MVSAFHNCLGIVTNVFVREEMIHYDPSLRQAAILLDVRWIPSGEETVHSKGASYGGRMAQLLAEAPMSCKHCREWWTGEKRLLALLWAGCVLAAFAGAVVGVLWWLRVRDAFLPWFPV